MRSRLFHGHFRLLVVALCLPLLSAVHANEASRDDDSDADAWRRQFHVALDLHPVGYTLHKGNFQLKELIPLHPAGFPARTTSTYPGPVVGLGQGWEAAALLSSAVPLGKTSGGLISGRFFYGGGLQKQLMGDSEFTSPALSVGGYYFGGPNSLRGGMGYLVASHRFLQKPESPARALFGHLGVKVETFKSSTASSTGIRPFAGANAALTRNFFLRGEYSPTQSWETRPQFSAKATYHFYKNKYGLSFGVRGNGYRTYPVVDFAF